MRTCVPCTLSLLQTHLSFGPEYEKAVEAKQVAQQQAERGKYIVLRALEEKKSTIIKAQGEAEAAKLVSSPVGGGRFSGVSSFGACYFCPYAVERVRA